ncbi:MAG: hypothetical protein Q9163_002775 [Psora crenata]
MAYFSTDVPAQESLATMPSGMTFAQKARAAELNASKRRQAARETEDEVPELAPVSLGALKFTKRTRGKGFQATTLDELIEEDASSDAALSQLPSSYATRSSTPNNGLVSDQYRGGIKTTDAIITNEGSSGPGLQYSPPRSDYSHDLLQKRSTTSSPLSDNYSQWSADMARQAGYSQYRYGALSSTSAPSHPASRQSSAMSRQAGMQAIRAGNLSLPPRSQADNTLSKAQHSPYGYANRNYTSSEESQIPAGKENCSSPVPSRRDSGVNDQGGSAIDDPFAKQAYLSTYTKGPAHRLAPNPRAAVRMPPAVKGTLDHAYRFPSGSDHSSLGRGAYPQGPPPPSLAGQISKQPVEYAESRALNDPKAACKTHIRDPHPYTGFTAPSSKTEMLMQSLENLKMENDVSTSGRTVLYDPVAQGASRKSSNPSESTVLPSLSARVNHAASMEIPDLHQDLLQRSDPLPPMGQQGDQPTPLEDSGRVDNGTTLNTLPSHEAQEVQLYETGQSGDASLESRVFGKAPTQEEKDAALMAWFNGKNPKHEHLRGILERRSVIGQEMVSTPPQQRTILGPIGSGRNFQQANGSSRPWMSYKADTAAKIRAEQQAANDLMAPVLANMHEHMLNDPNDPFTRYAQPPAWCIDTTPGGNKSLMGEMEWNPPPRVGRDPRYPTTFHEGRPTYFEEVGRSGGRR